MIVTKGLLIHWWHYYGKQIYTLQELEEFEKIIDEYGCERVLDVAVISYICGDGSPNIILRSMREDKVKEMFEALPNLEKMTDEEKESHKKIKQIFLEIITSTYK